MPNQQPTPAVDVSEWDDFYPDRVSIEAQTQTRNHRNEVVRDWAPVAELANISCAVRFARGAETFVGGSTGATGVQSASANHVIKLRGYFPGIKSQQRATVTNSETGKSASYDISAVAHTIGHSRTKLIATVALN